MAISLAALVGCVGGAFGQSAGVPASAATPPKTTWTPFAQAAPTTPSVPVGTAKLPEAPATAIATPPGLVPKTLTFQKDTGVPAPVTAAPPLTFPKDAGGTSPLTIVPPLTFPKDAGGTKPAGTVPAVPLTFQKEAGATGPLPPLAVPVPAVTVPAPVPAVPTAMVRVPQTPKDDEEKDKAKEKEKEKAREREREKAKSSDLTKGTLPNRDNVFRLTSDGDLNARIQKELGGRTDPFPTPPPLSAEALVYTPKTVNYPPVQALREPNYVVHRRLHFEEKNSERAGWEVGFLQPALSTGYFLKDVFFLPHSLASGLWKNRWDTSAGKCPPGAATPYYLYPPGFTVSGLMLETTLITGLVFIIP